MAPNFNLNLAFREVTYKSPSISCRLMTTLNARFRFALLIIPSVAICLLAVGSVLSQTYDINAMGRECTQKIGVIEPFNCLDGELIPITVNGRPVPTGHASPQKCDRPSLLSPAYCKLYSRVGRLPSLGPAGAHDPDVQVVFICRRYNDVLDQNDKYFKDVAIIQHRKSTGATCFFQHLHSYSDATRVPPPSELASDTPPGRVTSRQFWLAPTETASINCNNCHDAGPFIHSPYIDQVKDPSGSGETVVYPFPNVRHGEPTNYRFVGDPFQSWGIPELIKPDGNGCTTCHVFGISMSSSLYTKYSVGRADPVAITEAFTRYPKSHWMPPDQAREMPQRVFQRLYEESINQILGCGVDGTMASAPECNRRPFGP